MTESIKINFAELASTYEPIPDGEYTIKLYDVEPATSAAGNDMIMATYAITKGQHKGSEVRQWYVLNVKEKNGKISCMGLSQMAAIYKKIGAPEKKYAILDTNKIVACRLFQELLKGKEMEAFISTEARKDDPSKTSSRVKITGLAAGSYSTDIDEDAEEE